MSIAGYDTKKLISEGAPRDLVPVIPLGTPPDVRKFVQRVLSEYNSHARILPSIPVALLSILVSYRMKTK